MATEKILTVQGAKEMGARIDTSHTVAILTASVYSIQIGGGTDEYVYTTKQMPFGSGSNTPQYVWVNKSTMRDLENVITNRGSANLAVTSVAPSGITTGVTVASFGHYGYTGAFWQPLSTRTGSITQVNYGTAKLIDNTQTVRKDLFRQDIFHGGYSYSQETKGIFTNVKVNDDVTKPDNQMLTENEIEIVPQDAIVYLQILPASTGWTKIGSSAVKSYKASMTNLQYQVNGVNKMFNLTYTQLRIGAWPTSLLSIGTYRDNNQLTTAKENDIITIYPSYNPSASFNITSTLTITGYTGTGYTGTSAKTIYSINLGKSHQDLIVGYDESFGTPKNLVTLYANENQTTNNQPDTGDTANKTIAFNFTVGGLYVRAKIDDLILRFFDAIDGTLIKSQGLSFSEPFLNTNTILTKNVSGIPKNKTIKLSVLATLSAEYTNAYQPVTFGIFFNGKRGTEYTFSTNTTDEIDIELRIEKTSILPN
jgi:hypothetical protein